jgi:hypothetical protein
LRRFAQDDDFVRGLKKNTPNRLTLVGRSPGSEIGRKKSLVGAAGMRRKAYLSGSIETWSWIAERIGNSHSLHKLTWSALGPPPGNFQSSLRDFSSLDLYPGLRRTSGNLFGVFSSNLSQNRHPERSASQIYRVIQRQVARSRRTPMVLILSLLSGAFQLPKPEN